MNLLRNNLYLVILIVVTLVVGGVLLYLGSSKATQIEDTQIKPRLKISESLSRLVRRPRANAGTIADKKGRNAAAQKELNTVEANLLKYNRRNFKVGSLELLDDKGLRPVLPYALEVWRDNVLAQPYIESYHNSLNGFLGKLDAISIPTGKVIEREAMNLQARFDREEAARTKDAPGAKVRTAHQISSRAYQEAANKVKLLNAHRGKIYATKTCFDIRLTDMTESQLAAEEVWESQLNAWVQQDIVDALVKTNEDVQESLKIPANERCVINSAVKRLVRIEISGQSRREDTADARRPVMGPGMDIMGGPGMKYKKAKDKKKGRARVSKLERPDSLTGNTADKMMDVVNYSFTVVISTRYLPVLERKLTEQNFHFILNASIKSLPSIASVPASSDGKYSEEELSYYGVDPVSTVTITGQLALLTEWVRGTYDEKTKAWIIQPLMPVSVMEKLPPAALREQDKELISKKLPRPWDPSFVPADTKKRRRR